MMKTSENGRKFIEKWEEDGTPKLRPYNDGTGTLTIGFGHTTAAGPPAVHPRMAITPQEADEILSADLHSVEVDVNRLVKTSINQNQFDALVSFHFNTGALARSNVLRAINSGHLDLVPEDLMQWVHGGGHVMLGLVRRRRAEAALFTALTASSVTAAA
jgi:lysozyme